MFVQSVPWRILYWSWEMINHSIFSGTYYRRFPGAFLVAQMVKNLPAMQETWVRSLGWEERKWQPTRVFLPGEFHGQSSLVGYSPWSCKESGTTEWLTHTQGVDVTTRWQMRVPWLWALSKPISRVCDSWLPGMLVRAIFCPLPALRWKMQLWNFSFCFPQCFTLRCLLYCKEIKLDNPKENQSWMFTGRTDAEAKAPILWPPDVNEELTQGKRPWCWERLKVGGEGNDRGWIGWMASLTQWTWVWVNSGSWCWTGRPVVLQSMGLQRVGDSCATTELNWLV